MPCIYLKRLRNSKIGAVTWQDQRGGFEFRVNCHLPLKQEEGCRVSYLGCRSVPFPMISISGDLVILYLV